MTEMLMSTEIVGALGEDAVLLFRTLVGPLAATNLRNLHWHGFLLAEETQPQYVSLLLVSILSTATISRAGYDPSVLHWRGAYHRWPLTAASDAVCSLTKENLVVVSACALRCGLHPQAETSTLAELQALLTSSLAVLPGYEVQWLAAAKQLQSGQLHQALVLLFPVFEHALRVLFVLANDCIAEVFASHDHAYLTLDMILSLTLEDGSQNRLLPFLGTNMLAMLYELFVWESRSVRNMICHGAVDVGSIPLEQTQVAFLVSFSLVSQYSSGGHDGCSTSAALSRFEEQFIAQQHPGAKACEATRQVEQDLKSSERNLTAQIRSKASAIAVQGEEHAEMLVNATPTPESCIVASTVVAELKVLGSGIRSLKLDLKNAVDPNEKVTIVEAVKQLVQKLNTAKRAAELAVSGAIASKHQAMAQMSCTEDRDQ